MSYVKSPERCDLAFPTLLLSTRESPPSFIGCQPQFQLRLPRFFFSISVPLSPPPYSFLDSFVINGFSLKTFLMIFLPPPISPRQVMPTITPPGRSNHAKRPPTFAHPPHHPRLLISIPTTILISYVRLKLPPRQSHPEVLLPSPSKRKPPCRKPSLKYRPPLTLPFNFFFPIYFKPITKNPTKKLLPTD